MTTVESRTCDKLAVERGRSANPVAPRDECSLAEAVHAAVRAVDTRALVLPTGVSSSPGCAARVLLALLTYSYAQQVYRSEKIARSLRGFLGLGQLSDGLLPDAELLARFRNQNRELLRLCLTKALSFVVRQKIVAGLVTRMSDVQLAEEARRRIITAIFLDSVEPAQAETPSALTNL